MVKRNLFWHVLLPSVVTLCLMGLYFSGVPALQNLLTPPIPTLSEQNWREFGILEMLQNFVLALLILLILRSLHQSKKWLDRWTVLVFLSITSFIFLEEIDYGIPAYELISGQNCEREIRNWHNQKGANNHQHVRGLKKAVDAGLFMVMIGIYAGTRRKTTHPLSGLIPSRWFIATILLSVLWTKLAHLLSDMGLGVIDGVEGKISHNISEFRELNIYYVVLLYGLQLYRWRFHRGDAGG